MKVKWIKGFLSIFARKSIAALRRAMARSCSRAMNVHTLEHEEQRAISLARRITSHSARVTYGERAGGRAGRAF